jgi:hypothetical protein
MIQEDLPCDAAFELPARAVHRPASSMKFGGEPLDIDFLSVHWQK